jgi:hypothetical protein
MQCAQVLEASECAGAAEQALGCLLFFGGELPLKAEGRTWEQAKSFAGEREAAAQFGALRPKLPVGCVKLLEERQGCTAADGRREGFACCLPASFI